MKNFILFVLLLVLIGEGTTLFFMKREKTSKNILAEKTVSSPLSSPTPFLTPTPTALPSPTPKPTPVKTPTPIPQPKYTSAEINQFIDRFSAQYGVDPNVIRYIAICESGFNPSAKKLGYAGLFQFGSATWQNLRRMFGEDPNNDLRYNAEEAVQTAAYAISIGKKGIWPNCYP